MTARQSRIRRAIRKARRFGEVRVEFAKPDGIGPEAVDRFVQSRGFHPVEEEWIELDRATAEERLAHILGIDLAYHGATMDAPRAVELARQFLRTFASDARFFTNKEARIVQPDGSASRGGTPLTDATIDDSVAGIDAAQVGIVVVMDED